MDHPEGPVVLRIGATPRRRRRERIAQRRWWLEPYELELYELEQEPLDAYATYLSHHAYEHVVHPILNPPGWEELVNNKLIFSSYYRQMGVRVPLTYGLLHPTAGFVVGGRSLRSTAELTRWAQDVEIASFVLKPVGGSRGTGVILVDDVRWLAGAASFRASDGRGFDERQLEEQLVMSVDGTAGYLVQERIPQHRWFDDVNPGAANSLRVVTFRPQSGEPFVQLAALRMGRVGGMVENWAQGGLAIGVDVASGVLGPGRLKPPHGGWTESHPDSQVTFAGRSVPDWDEIVDLVVSAARVTPELRSIGWDVVLSDQGPCIVEGNVHWDLHGLQIHAGGLLGSNIASDWSRVGVDLPDGSRAWHARHHRSLSRRMGSRLLKTVRKRWG